MSLESLTSNPLNEFFQERGYVNLWEVYDPNLHEREESADLAIVRTGPISFLSGVRHPLGTDQRVQMAGLFYYDPKRGEIKIERVDPTNQKQVREQMEADGWKLIPSAEDRVVGYRPLSAE